MGITKNPPGFRKCQDCKLLLELTVDNFSPSMRSKDSFGFRYRCRSCELLRSRSPKKRDYNLRRNYGITLAERDAIVDKQKGLCAICRLPMCKPQVDHDHVTGKVRGMLCMNHNQGLGKFQDSADLLTKASEYISRSKVDFEYF